MERHTKKSAQAYERGPLIQLLGGHSAPLSLYLKVEQQVTKQMGTLIPDRLYTLKQIIGGTLWEMLPDNNTKRIAGRCFAHMVSVRTFPLKFVQYKRYCTKRYQLK